MEPDDDARLDRLESLADITRLVNEYCIAMDDRDLERFAALWHPDATWASSARSVTGIRSIVDAIEDGWTKAPRSRHFSANLVIELDGDRATSRSAVLIAVQFPDGARSRYGRDFSDVFERRSGEWRIASRTVGESVPLDGVPEAFGA
ncbi:hypothetical protein BH10ACT7_BH10ACT7_27770 [soil metagenome]